jgi:predicted dienelactone hydrolase
VQRCADHPDSVECVFVRASHGDQLDPDPPAVTWTHEPRISAVVVAAPAVTLLFGPGDLAKVHAPVQLWRAEADTNVPDAYDTGPLRTLLVPMPEEHVVPKAGHFVFQAPCSPAFAAQASAICNDSPGVDRAAFHKEFDRKVTAFFRRHLMAR